MECTKELFMNLTLGPGVKERKWNIFLYYNEKETTILSFFPSLSLFYPLFSSFLLIEKKK